MGSIPRLCIPHQGWDRSQGCASLTRDGMDPEAVHPSLGMGSIPGLCIPPRGWDRSRGCASLTRDGLGSIPRLWIPHWRWDRSRGCASLTRAGMDPKAVHPSPGLGSIPRLCIPHWRWDRSRGCASLTRDGMGSIPRLCIPHQGWDGIDPEAVHPSPGMGSIPRLWIPHQGWDGSQGCASLSGVGRTAQPAWGGAQGPLPSLTSQPPGPGQGEGSWGCAGGAPGSLPKGSSEGYSEPRMEQGAGMEQWGHSSAPQGEGPALPQCLSPLPHGSSGGPRRGDTGHGAPVAPREPRGWARARPCPSLPVEGSHSSNTLPRSPTRRGRRLDGPGGGAHRVSGTAGALPACLGILRVFPLD
ncbi:translation initiation factor IF-2-like isoform X1 [Pipra filicauda]|uniref:Translation initiation factor IF-2-like isoform X1 n=1 Tax=Pipra filicauda TaxID=649802 RepID=A0A7R5KP66_9PASS|nr:translation initiation factor IF-2-like isoform X1 [Pipra filicauda]